MALTSTLTPFLDAGIRPELLSAILKTGRPEQLPSGSVLYRQGEPADEMHILLTGAVQIHQRVDARSGQHLTTIMSPTLLGHIGLLAHSRRSATCIVEGRAEVLRLSRETAEGFVADTGPVGTAFRRMLLISMSEHLLRGDQTLRDQLVTPLVLEPIGD